MESRIYQIRKAYTKEELASLFGVLCIEAIKHSINVIYFAHMIEETKYSDAYLDQKLYNDYTKQAGSEKMITGYFRTILFYTEYEDIPLYVVSPNITIQIVAMWRLKLGK